MGFPLINLLHQVHDLVPVIVISGRVLGTFVVDFLDLQKVRLLVLEEIDFPLQDEIDLIERIALF